MVIWKGVVSTIRRLHRIKQQIYGLKSSWIMQYVELRNGHCLTNSLKSKLPETFKKPPTLIFIMLTEVAIFGLQHSQSFKEYRLGKG
jgi:hypothetical protein